MFVCRLGEVLVYFPQLDKIMVVMMMMMMMMSNFVSCFFSSFFSALSSNKLALNWSGSKIFKLLKAEAI